MSPGPSSIPRRQYKLKQHEKRNITMRTMRQMLVNRGHLGSFTSRGNSHGSNLCGETIDTACNPGLQRAFAGENKTNAHRPIKIFDCFAGCCLSDLASMLGLERRRGILRHNIVSTTVFLRSSLKLPTKKGTRE